MPSKFSDQLKQAIIYIKAGELEIAKEIIMEIIQKDPEYEKAWIWLVETMPNKREKADILKTRIEQFPDSSPLAHRVLQKIALDLLEDYSTEEEPEEEIAVDDVESEEPIEELINENLEPVEENDTEFEDIDSLFEESIKGEEEFLSVDKFDQLLKDEIEENISGDEMDLNLLIDEEDYDEVLEQDLEQFLQNDINEGYFKETINNKPHQVEESEEENDLFGFDSYLQKDDGEIDENDEFSSLLSQYVDPEEAPAQPEQDPSNPFILNPEESIHLFGEDINETSKTNEEETTNPSSNAFSEEGLKDFEMDSHEFEQRLGLLSDDEMIFPNKDRGAVEAINADDVRYLIEDKVIDEDIEKKSFTSRKSSKKHKKKGDKGKKDKRTFMNGCSIIAAVILLALLGLGVFFMKNWQSRPQEPTLIVLPSATPTEEISFEIPWLEEEAKFKTFILSELEI